MSLVVRRLDAEPFAFWAGNVERGKKGFQSTDVSGRGFAQRLDRARETDDRMSNVLTMTVGGRRLGGGGLGLSREEMPQVPREKLEEYLGHLRDRGVLVERVAVDPRKLKPTQREVSAAKSGEMLQSLRSGGTGKPIVISRDGHVIDGHHQWAAGVARSYEVSGVLLPAIRVHMSTRTLLADMQSWASSQGLETKAMGAAELLDVGPSHPRPGNPPVRPRVGPFVFKDWAHNNVPGKKGFQPKQVEAVHETEPWDFTPHMVQSWIDDNTGATQSMAAGHPNEIADQVLKQLEAFSDSQPTLYRGMNTLSDEAVAKFKPGSTVDFVPSSFSPTQDYAEEFTGFGEGGNGVLLRVASGARGINLFNYVGDDYLRDFGDPQEVICGGRFRVSRVTPHPVFRKTWVVDLTQEAEFVR